MSAINTLKRVQTVMRDGGFDPGPIDGRRGRLTVGGLDRLFEAAEREWAGLASPAPTGLKDPGTFWRTAREHFGAFDQQEVDGINRLLKAAGDAGWPISWTAYGALASPWHESLVPAAPGRPKSHMQPVAELGKGRGKSYGVPGRNGGQVPYGRGDLQITHDRNYEGVDRGLGLNGALIRDYDLLIKDPAVSARALIWGLENAQFDANGKTIAQRLPRDRPATREQMKNARPLVNVMDRADLIAGYGMGFQTALQAGGWGPVA